MIVRYIGLVGLVMLSTGLNAQHATAVLGTHARTLPGLRTGTGHGPAALGVTPVNDQCNLITAEQLEVGSVLTFTGTTTGATINGDYTDGSILFGMGVPVVWVSFTTTECANVTIDYCGSASVFSDYFNILSLDCPATDDLVISPVYNETECGDGNATIYFDQLPAGTYQYPVWSDATTADGPYTIHVTAASCVGPVGPPNDFCDEVTPQSLVPDQTVTFTGDNTGATDSEGLGYSNVWEAFTLTQCTSVRLEYCATDFSSFAQGLFMECPIHGQVEPSSVDACDGGQLVEVFQSLAAGTYYIPVMLGDNAEGAYSIKLFGTGCTATMNDECEDAFPLNVGVECTPVQGSVVGATVSLPPIDCNGNGANGGKDVWFTYVATSAQQTVHASAHDINIVLEVFKDVCAGLVSSGCADLGGPGVDEEVTLSAQEPGTTYHVRVYDGGGAQLQDSTFTICVTGDLSTGVTEHDAALFAFFPNPSNGDLTLTHNAASGNVSVEVFDMTGRLVVTERTYLTKGEQRAFQWAGRLSPGSYTIRVTGAEGSSQQRFVVK